MVKQLSRRTCLRGTGVALALPFLEAMAPRRSAAAPGDDACRFVAVFVPHGIHMPAWTPAQSGADFPLSPILEPLDAHRAKLNVLSNFENHPASITTEEFAGSHARGTGAFLTSRRLAFTAESREITNGISLDQVLAQGIGDLTPLPSLELGVRGGSSTGDCEDGYSCAYLHNIAWSGPGQPAPKETDPQQLYQRLAGVFVPSGGEGQPTQQMLHDRRVLDHVLEEADALNTKLGSADRAKLGEYLESVYEVEQRLNDLTTASCTELPPAPGEYDNYQEHVRLMFDLMALSFQCDLTRVATFMMENPFSSRSFEFLGIPDDHHYLSHHGGQQSKLDAIQAINTWEVEQLAYFLDRLDAIQEGERTALDNSMVLFSSEFGDGDDHYHHDLPVLLAGSAGGQFETGRHLEMPDRHPLANLGLTVLQTLGLPDESFGEDGDTPVDELFA